MKPKTAIQRKVAQLSATLRPLTPKQIQWAYDHCVEHIAYRAKSGTMTCSDCGHQWKSGNGSLCDTLAGCKCPHCGAELKVQDTRKRTFRHTQYFSVTTTYKGFQVIRVSQLRFESKKGEPMKFYCHEVVQRWISPEGKVVNMALLRGFPFFYCDLWALDSEMEVRPNNSLYDDVCQWSDEYPAKRYIPQLKRNGFNGKFYGIMPVTLMKELLSNPPVETLMKAGKINEMKHFINNPENGRKYWDSYKIAMRHRYQITNLSLWFDYLRMLDRLGKDVRNPKNICPADFINAHDTISRKIEAIRRREREEQQRKINEERLLREKKNEEKFNTLKAKFFGLVITDSEIEVKVLESIEEYLNEGETQHICVFSSEYYLKKDSLVLSARINGTIIETVEVDLKTLKVVQCHGKYNQDTEYHDRIIDLVNSNAKLIRERMTA
ncbi:PcfJ domain-containing protein [Bacteroides acidifaciens]|uniref:PcfJ domain-containing protein n=1 Tax=Bacteroides acidifaciens TaxID=85831 RepID=UPI0026ECCE14|nr:PcfJ domain-containing protein [Bacteroides acidifaciens]